MIKTANLPILALAALLYNCNTGAPEPPKEPFKMSSEPTAAERKLEARNAEFIPAVTQVTKDVYVSTGYDVSSISMIVGDDGYILIDTGMTPESVTQTKAEFEKITDKPLKGIIYTHEHRDHVRGTAIFTEGKNIPIWARSNFGGENRFHQTAGINPGFRGARQAGITLPDSLRINNGIARAVSWSSPPKGKGESGQIKRQESPSKNIPTHTFDGAHKTLNISNVNLELYAAPGETDDQLYVWLPNKNVLFAGDNFYKSWPNLYTIRGTAYRDAHDWIQSLQSMLEKDAEVLVGGHTKPIIGKEKVKEVLTNYHGSVQFVFEKTVEGMNKGLTPDQLVEYVQLPEKYRALDYLHGYYGRVDWSVRQIFNGYLGWFDGNATSLIPLSEKEEAQKIIALAGGEENMVNQIKFALHSEEFQWAAQLVDYLLVSSPDHTGYKELKAIAMTALGRHADNALARNYYLTTAQELRKQ